VPRHLRCRECRALLGSVHGETLRPREGMRISVYPSAGRVTMICPACGAARDWRDGCVLIERARVVDSVATDEAATGRRSER